MEVSPKTALSASMSIEESEEENVPFVDYYVSPLAQIHRGSGCIQFSSGCVVLPGSRITLHHETYAETQNEVTSTRQPLNVDVDTTPERDYYNAPTVVFAPYTLVEEYAEIDIYLHPRDGTQASHKGRRKDMQENDAKSVHVEENTPTPVTLTIGSHNRFKSYSKVSIDYSIGEGNLFFPHARVNLCTQESPFLSSDASSRAQNGEASCSATFAIGHDCRFGSHVCVTPINLAAAVKRGGVDCSASRNIGAEESQQEEGRRTFGSEWIMNHLSFLMGAPPDISDGDDNDDSSIAESEVAQDEGALHQGDIKKLPIDSSSRSIHRATAKKKLPTVWVVPTGGTRSLMESPPQGRTHTGPSHRNYTSSDQVVSDSAKLEESARNRNEVEQMCRIYMELYGTWAYIPE